MFDFALIYGILMLGFGTLITVAATLTLLAIFNRKSLRQLRMMTTFILIIGFLYVL